MSKPVSALIAATFFATSAATSAFAQTTTPVRWTDPEFVQGARCFALAMQTDPTNSKKWADRFKQERQGRADWVVQDADDAARIAIRIIRSGKDGGSRAKEFEALKVSCVSFLI